MSLDHRGEDSSFELLVSDLRRHAVGTQAINVDFLEYCNFCNLFQAAIETTVNRKKPFTIVRNLAKAANCHGYVMILNNWGRGEM